MLNLKVDLSGKSYPIFIGTDLLSRLSEIYKLYGYKSRALIITDHNLQQTPYLNTLTENFSKINIEIIPIFLTAQQSEQGLKTVQQIANQLLIKRFEPEDTIMSLGGSKVMHIGAFVAQMTYGGVGYFQIPTTLTAQVVSSVEPLAYLNFDLKLNFLAMRYEHSLVWSDVSILKSLPEKNLISGLAYIIQSACSQNSLFEFLEKNLENILNYDLTFFEEVIFRSCQTRIHLLKEKMAKRKHLEQYEFGEFIATVIMSSTHNNIKFGEALLVGMLVEGIIGFKVGLFNGPYFERFYKLIKKVPFHHFIHQIDHQKLIECFNDRMSHHKQPPLNIPQQFGKVIPYNEYKLSHFISAIELVLSD